ncbi:bifunctional UDP-N-acetylmuramoyl-tripeptide:D-alanyl-D-alanine ligase/alanine racemase [Parapedobacter deserti]|uniref:Alanine racemase n=1 Tax=Parapedobacter deserti TaxID=1912957 RepID=A0ABV7JLQ4_9SPHI
MAISEQRYTIQDIADVLSPVRVFLPMPAARVSSLLYDSRKLADANQGLFFALKGRRNGHAYVNDAYAGGVRNFVVAEAEVNENVFPGANFIFVYDTLEALQSLAAYHRSRFTYPVIGITGSNGKTIVKEWLGQLLSPEYRIISSPKSYNSQIGVALSLWRMDAGHNLAIVEAGISQPGEMQFLQRMIRPDIAVLTNIGPAHDEGFASRTEKAVEKLRLFEGAKTMVYSPPYLQGMAMPPAGQHVTWGQGEAALQVLHHERITSHRCRIYGRYRGNDVFITIPFSDGASRENATCCWAVMLTMGYSPAVINERMALLQPVEMRLEMKRGINNCTLVDDSYSNDLASLGIALDFIRQQHQHVSRTLVLSDIPGTGRNEEEVYANVYKLLVDNGINRLITVGERLADQAFRFQGIRHEAFPNTEALLEALPSMGFHDEIILLKGARAFTFERISQLLAAKLHDTVLEINLNALEHNLGQFKSLLPAHVKLMAMVKAFSYGSGSFEVANLLQFNKVDYLAVAYVDEGVELRKGGIHLPIMVMNPSPAAIGSLLRYDLEPEVYSFSVLGDLVRTLSNRGMAEYPVHIKLDTGMHRLGFGVNDINQLTSDLSETNAVKVKSVFSHLAAAGEGEHDAFTKRQLASFDAAVSRLRKVLGYPFICHIANTAAIQRWPGAHLDMVRLGIGLYGIRNAGNHSIPLQQVCTLKTAIAQLRRVPAGESVGYGCKGILTRERIIATVNVGYADGYDRRFGNGVGCMVINGKAVRTVGDICMDMAMVDVTGVEVREGDEVVVLDDLAQQAAAIGTIPYELLAGISQRVKRVYFYG